MRLILNVRRIFVQKIKYASGIAGKLLPFHVFGNASLLTMSIGTGVVVAVAFHEVDYTPHRETGTEGDNERLKNRDSLIDESHRFSSLI